MASVELLTAFLVGTLVYSAVPGPGTVYVTAQAVTHDTRAALRAAVGLHLGGYVIVLASAAGLTALFAVVPILFEVLKIMGAVYLVWLGIQIVFFDRAPRGRSKRTERRGQSGAGIVKGALVEVLNPTTAVFYVAFLPQFIDPAALLPVWAQFVILGAVVNVIFSLPDFAAILISSGIKARAESSALGRRIFECMAGTVLIGLGLRLAASRA